MDDAFYARRFNILKKLIITVYIIITRIQEKLEEIL